jgi:hypothetical protein
MPVILVSRVVDKKRIIRKNQRAESEERPKGLTQTKNVFNQLYREIQEDRCIAWKTDNKYCKEFLSLGQCVAVI